MADNYLEKQYESYEARKAAWERAKKLGKKKSKSSIKTPAKPATDDETADEE